MSSGYDFFVPPSRSGDAPGAWGDDVASRLLGERIIVIGSPITDEVAGLVVAQMLMLAHAEPARDIRLSINSPGGAATAGLAIYDAMQAIACDVATLCLGMCGGPGVLLLAGGTAGKRSALPHARLRLDPGAAELAGSLPDIEAAAREALGQAQRTAELLARHSGRPSEAIRREMEQGRYLSAEEARDYGLIDQVVTSPTAW